MADERAYVLAWRSAVLNSNATSTMKLCLIVLAEFADADGGNCYPSIPTIAATASVNEKTVRRSLDEAERAGFIDRSHVGAKHGWRRFVYALTLPAGADTVPARDRQGADTVPTPQATTCGLSVRDVRTLSPQRAGTAPTDLSTTYPLPSKTTAAPAADAARRRDPIWGSGLQFLASKGVPEPQARSFLGRLCKQAGEVRVVALLADAEALDVVAPLQWLSKAAPARATRSSAVLPRDQRSEDEIVHETEQAAARLKRRFGAIA